MVEQRRSERETTISPPISCFADLPDGTVLEGVVVDLSDQGARVSGLPSGLRVGDEIRLVLVILADQRVVYRAEVKHLDVPGRFFGLRFTSGPQPLETEDRDLTKQMCCGHKQDTPFCAYCGRLLHKRRMTYAESKTTKFSPATRSTP